MARNNAKKSPNFKENEDQPMESRYQAKIAVND